MSDLTSHTDSCTSSGGTFCKPQCSKTWYLLLLQAARQAAEEAQAALRAEEEARVARRAEEDAEAALQAALQAVLLAEEEARAAQQAEAEAQVLTLPQLPVVFSK